MSLPDLPTDFQKYIYKSRYARWLDSEKRREYWHETVRRYCQFWEDKYPWLAELDDWHEAEQAILNLEVMPSMRALMTAGEALDRDNLAGYNCAYIAADTPKAFDEAVYVLMCGTGLGYSVERQFINQLPEVPKQNDTDTVINVKDSKIGWAAAYRELVSLLYAGQVPKWDLSKIRPAGARLKTFGGRASGPKPLDDLFRFTVGVFAKAQGRKLTSVEVHDLFCKIADIVVVGGVRRSALISLSNLTDERMRHAKSGSWWVENPHRALANNSVCYTEKPDIGIFIREWLALYDSKSGERGVFSRDAAKKHLKKNVPWRDPNHEWGCNPCSEILLRPAECCNLSEVVIRTEDNFTTLKRKIKIATIFGTLQSTLTNIRYVRPIWKKNMEEERLLGVSLTGIMDHYILSDDQFQFSRDLAENFGIDISEIPLGSAYGLPHLLTDLKKYARTINEDWAGKLGINVSAAITCVKPSGTVSQLVNSSSGIHPRFSQYYIRTVRVDKKDPLYHYMKSAGFPVEDEVLHPESTAVFSFPIKSPDGSVLVKDRTAIEQLELWKVYAEHWCEHKPSVTVYVKEDEWLEVGAWCYKNFDILSGVSFLPHSGHTYQQAPYQECTEEDYLKAQSQMPSEIDWTRLSEFESEDTTSVQPELSCSAGACEL